MSLLIRSASSFSSLSCSQARPKRITLRRPAKKERNLSRSLSQKPLPRAAGSRSLDVAGSLDTCFCFAASMYVNFHEARLCAARLHLIMVVALTQIGHRSVECEPSIPKACRDCRQEEFCRWFGCWFSALSTRRTLLFRQLDSRARELIQRRTAMNC